MPDFDALFEEWRKSYDSFAEDGIISPGAWAAAPRKVLFVLKETNHFAGDLRLLLREKPWPTLGRWAWGLQRVAPGNLPLYPAACREEAAGCRSAAVLNLKKTPGREIAHMADVEAAAARDRERIAEEIRLIAPEIVVCGGTAEICRKIFGGGTDLTARAFTLDAFGKAMWLDFVHPSQVIPIRPDIVHYGLLGYYLEAGAAEARCPSAGSSR